MPRTPSAFPFSGRLRRRAINPTKRREAVYLSLPPTRHGSKARRPIKVGIKGRGRSGTNRDSNPAGLCCSSAHLVQCEPDEASSFTNPNVGPGTYASLRWQKGQECSSPTRRLPSRSCGRIRPRAVFILRPTNVRIWHKAVFKVGPVAGPKPNTRGSSKNASDPVGIPLFGAPQAPGDKPNPSEEGKSLGGRPPEARGDISSGETHPNRLCSSQPQSVESAPPQDTKQHRLKKKKKKKKKNQPELYLSYVPPTYEYGTRPFLRWVLSQGRSPTREAVPKNASDPVGIPLFGAPQAPGDKPNPSEEG